ncbi:MAG: hypothetical protein FWC78_09040 [Defluviitaleaceae bacterium]|nr:hypothetical protein [Defluviitaleaceae bacterium]
MNLGNYDNCYLYGMPYVRPEEIEERPFRYPPLYMRMRRHFWRRRYW